MGQVNGASGQRRQAQDLFRPKRSELSDSVRTLPSVNHRGGQYPTSWCKGVHEARRTKWFLGCETGRGVIVPDDVAHDIWAVPVETDAVRDQLSP